MNEQLQQALASILDKTMKGVEAGVGFLQAELPEVIQQLLTWKLAESILLVSIGIAFISISIFLVRKAIPAITEYNKWGDQYISNCGNDLEKEARAKRIECEPKAWGYGLSSLIATMISFPVFFGVIGKTKDILQIWLAPKIYLIEYAASLAK